MSYLPDDVPAPDINADDAPFWDHVGQRRLTFQCCADCQYVQHPPTPFCPKCHSTRRNWIDAPEFGEVFTYTITHHPSHPSVKPSTPYNIVVVDYPELGHVRLISNMVDGNDIEIGMKVRLVWDEQGGRPMPRFERVVP